MGNRIRLTASGRSESRRLSRRIEGVHRLAG
jgi:hypothetical protein